MAPNPSSIPQNFPQEEAIDHLTREHDIAYQEMPASPVVPAISPDEGTFVAGRQDYFSPSVTTAPLPPTSDSFLSNNPEEALSVISTPLTSISASSFFIDSSAAVSLSTLSSTNSASPPISPLQSPSAVSPLHVSAAAQSQRQNFQLSLPPRQSNLGPPQGQQPSQSHPGWQSAPNLTRPHPGAFNTHNHPQGMQINPQLEHTNIYNPPLFNPYSPTFVRHPRTAPAGQGTASTPFRWQRNTQSPSPQRELYRPVGGPQLHQFLPFPPPSGFPNQFQSFQSQHSFAESFPISPQVHDPATHINTAEPAFLGTAIARDAMLTYAYRIYNSPTLHVPPGLTAHPHATELDPSSPSHAYQSQLLPLLKTMRSLHPHHLPTLLLLSCVYYAVSDYEESMSVCSAILSIDPNFVEAMSNMGMALKATGRPHDAEIWWLKAVKLRPTYWDAMDNLLGVLCAPTNDNSGNQIPPRYEIALEVADYVLNTVIRQDGLLLVIIPPAHLHRLQNLLYTSGNLRSIISNDIRTSLHDHSRSLELMLRPPGMIEAGEPTQLRDVVVATVVVGLLASLPSTSPTLGIIAASMEMDPTRFKTSLLERGIDWLQVVHRAGNRLVEVLLRIGGGVLPLTLLTPEKAQRIPSALFNAYSGCLPALCVRMSYESPWKIAQGIGTGADANKMTSTVLLTLAKNFQPRTDQHVLYLPGPDPQIPRSLSLTMALYYLANALNPTASTYNNMGIAFSSITQSATTINASGQRETINGAVLAHLYYAKGLEIDPSHPHLLTNLGSLLKDQGRTLEAIKMYQTALAIKPDFDVALANIANAIKDSGRISESIPYYQRAMAVAPDFPDVICGLVNALSSICDWRGGRGSIGNEPMVTDQLQLVYRTSKQDTIPHGWMGKLETATQSQLDEGYLFGTGVIQTYGSLEDWIELIKKAHGTDFPPEVYEGWSKAIGRFFTKFDRISKGANEAGIVIRLTEYLNRVVQQRWFKQTYRRNSHSGNLEVFEGNIHEASFSARIRLPASLEPPPIPSVLPFHTFSYAFSPRLLRLVAYRNALRISHLVMKAPWVPDHVYAPPPPPEIEGKLNIGYISSDFGNHPLSHLMLSVFGLHNRDGFNTFVYATNNSDNSHYRHKIETESQVFRDVSSLSTQDIVTILLRDKIHILVNLGGYTKGARNDIFAARPAPIQVSLMGYAATSAASWCDYLVCDKYSCPPEAFAPYRSSIRVKNEEETSRLQSHLHGLDTETDIVEEGDPESFSNDWAFTEKFLHMPHTYFVTDHRQSFREDDYFGVATSVDEMWRLEERRRYEMRKEIFPDLPDDSVIFACFSQLYKICPSVFAIWLKILERVPGSILWLLRFPSAGEQNLLRTAEVWAGAEVASRVRFTDIARKEIHIKRCRVADLFLDTFQCNAHTIAADVLWTGTPILTFPKDTLKMCTRVASSIAYATGFGDQMTVESEHAYEERAVNWALGVVYNRGHHSDGTIERRGSGELLELRRNIFLHRDQMPLFDTPRWTLNLEKGYREIWKRWAQSCENAGRIGKNGDCIVIEDADPFFTEKRSQGIIS